MKFKMYHVLPLALALLFLLSGCGGATATSMRLRKIEGEVQVSDGKEKSVEAREDLALYSGYDVGTEAKSYSWIDLDSAKLIKMDESSQVGIEKDGGNLKLQLESGTLFFDIAKPLEDNESMEIRTSTLGIGIRGTCGWVDASADGTTKVYILLGKVECTAGEKSAFVSAGEMAYIDEDGEIVVRRFDSYAIPPFVDAELGQDEAKTQAVSADHEWADATYTEPKTCALCGLTEGEPLPEPYFVKNNIAFEQPQELDLPYAIVFQDAEGTKQVDIDGMWIEMGAGTAHYKFGEASSKPSEQEGYIDVTVPYEITLAAEIYQDSSKYKDRFKIRYNCTPFGMVDFYTGLLVPLDIYTANGGSAENRKEFEWDGRAYSIAATSGYDSEGGWSDWKTEDGIIYHCTYSLKLTTVLTITIPSDYDGAVLYIERGGVTEIDFDKEEKDKNRDVYMIGEGRTASDYIFYRLSDLIK